jgi:hypothetical protein
LLGGDELRPDPLKGSQQTSPRRGVLAHGRAKISRLLRGVLVADDLGLPAQSISQTEFRDWSPSWVGIEPCTHPIMQGSWRIVPEDPAEHGVGFTQMICWWSRMESSDHTFEISAWPCERASSRWRYWGRSRSRMFVNTALKIRRRR